MSKRVFLFSLSFFFLFCLFLIFMFPRDLWLDPAFTIETVHKLKYEGLQIDWRSYDVHPPAYYLTAYVWSFLTPPFIAESDWIELLSVVFGIGFFILVWIALRKIFGERVATLTVTSMMLMSTFFHYFTEARMYPMLMLMSAIFIAGMVNEFEKNWIYAGMFTAMIMPLTHYFAIAGFAYLMVMAFFFLKESSTRNEKIKKRLMLFSAIWSVSSVVSILLMISQVSRVPRNWLPYNGVKAWISDMIQSAFYAETMGMKTNAIIVAMYVLLAAGIVYMIYWGFASLKEGMSQKDKFLFFMIMTALGPLLAEVLLTTFGPQARYFMVVLWMFPAAAAIVVAQKAEEGGVKGTLISALFLMTILIMFMIYFIAQRNDIMKQEEIIGCGPAVVIHDNTFSYLSFEVTGREKGCGWMNLLSTDWSEQRLTSVGGDVVDREKIIWDKSNGGFNDYFVVAKKESRLIVPGWKKIYMTDDWVVVRYGEDIRLNYTFKEVNMSDMVFVNGMMVPQNSVRFETYEEECREAKKGWCK